MLNVTRHMQRVALGLIVTVNLLALGGVPSFSQDTQSQETQTQEAPSQPPWQVCNETSFILDIAIAGVPAGQAGKPISIWGWQSLRPGACQIVDVEKGTPRFVYARSADLHQGGIREWKGRFAYCVAKENFTAKTDISCELQNMKAASFLQIVPTESRTAFVEPDDFGRRAETAGFQRLLRDNNYDIKRIDGRTGKRTSQTLAKFFKDLDQKVPRKASEKFEVLEKRAQETRNTIGVKFCNKSTGKIWTALAYKNHGTFEAKGWWPVEKGRCIHPFAESLKDREAHYYVRQELSSAASGEADRILKVTGNQAKLFCIGPSKFSSLHHEFCQDRGYVDAKFKAVPQGKLGVEITLTDTDFLGAVVSGLRP